MEKKQILIKNSIHVFSFITILLVILFLIYAYKVGLFTSSDQLSYIISKAGLWGPLLFILLQIIQVIIPILPGGVSCVAGVIIFGPLYGFFYNYMGLVIGSIINFALARYYGKFFIQTVVSHNTYEKYIGWLDKGKHFDKFFALAIFMPIAPDDFLCMLAGLTKMTYKRFITIITLGKPISLFIYSMGLSSALKVFTTFIR